MGASKKPSALGGSARPDVREPVAPLVLVVDDNNEIREMMAEALEQEGYRVSTASNGKVALELAHQRRPQLILLDLMMPVMSGWQFLQAQREDPELATVPVVVVSAASDAHPEGAAAFMRKPFGLATLLSTVGQFCDAGGMSSSA